MSGIKRLIYDLEVSPNIGFFWRSGYKNSVPEYNIIQERAIICAAWKWEGATKVHHATWDGGNDRPVVEQLLPALMEADELIGHNIDRFDLPWYNTRHLIHKLPPLPIMRTVDTLQIARKRFYFNSNKLDYIAQLLGLGCKHKTDHELWRKIVLDNDPASLRRIVSYCRQDVKLTEQVWAQLSSYHNAKTHTGVVNGSGRWSCPHCGSENVSIAKTRPTAKGIMQTQMHCRDCGRYYTVSDLVRRQYEAHMKGES